MDRTKQAGVAQLVEHLICNQRVGGSSPFASSRIVTLSAPPAAAGSRSKPNETRSSPRELIPAAANHGKTRASVVARLLQSFVARRAVVFDSPSGVSGRGTRRASVEPGSPSSAGVACPERSRRELDGVAVHRWPSG